MEIQTVYWLWFICAIFFVILTLSEIEKRLISESFFTYLEQEIFKFRLRVSLNYDRFRMTLARLHKKGLKFLFGK